MIALQDPRKIVLSGSNQELLAQVSAASASINSRRPFSPEIGTRLRDALLPDRIVASLNMEGIVATRRQTLGVMDAMRIHESAGRGEQEILNALKADEFVNEAEADGTPLDERFVRELNRLLLLDLRDDAGAYRAGDVQLPGAPFPPPAPSDVQPLVGDLCSLFPLSEASHPIVQACWLHAQFTLIHPFSDGNGREGRLLQDWALLRKGLLPVGMPPSKRDDYYAALEAADVGEWNDLVEMVALLQLSMTSKVGSLIDEQQQRKTWIQRLSLAAASKEERTQHKNYIVWRKRMEELSQSFGQATIELDASSTIIGATFRDYGVLEFRDWERICQRGQIDKSWLFSLLFFAEGKPFYKTIAYFKRHVPITRVDTVIVPRGAVALYFTGTQAPVGSRPDFINYSDPHIRLREVLVLDDRQFVYRHPNPDGDWEVAELASPGELVEEFFLDVFNRKAGVGA